MTVTTEVPIAPYFKTSKRTDFPSSISVQKALDLSLSLTISSFPNTLFPLSKFSISK